MTRGEQWKLGACLFVATACIYLLGYRGVTAGDDLIHVQASARLASIGSMAFSRADYDPVHKPLLRLFFREGTNGAVYTTLSPGLAVASAPFCWVAEKALGPRAGDVVLSARLGSEAEGLLERVRSDPLAFAAGLVNPLAMALTVVLFFALGVLEGAPPGWAAFAALGLGFGTLLWCYAESYWTQPLCLMCLLSGFVLLRWFAMGIGTVAIGAIGGFLAGLAGLVRFEAFAFSVGLVAFTAALCLRRGRARLLLVPVVGLLVPIGLAAWWNWHRFGSPFVTGSPHGSMLGLFGRHVWSRLGLSLPANTVGLNQGLLVFAPPTAVSMIIAMRQWRRLDAFEWVAVLGSFAMVIFYSAFTLWETAESWGPRFLVLAVPFAAVPVLRHAREASRIAFLVTSAVGVGIQAIGVLTILDVSVIKQTMKFFVGDGPELLLASEIRLQFRKLLEHGPDPFWWSQSTTSAIVGGVLAIVAVLAFAYALRLVAHDNWSVQEEAPQAALREP